MPEIAMRLLLSTLAVSERGCRLPDEEEHALIGRLGDYQIDFARCAYLPGYSAEQLELNVSTCKPEAYEELLARNYRRSGKRIYRPVCSTCAACRSIRVLVDEFTPNRSMRRCWKRNSDLKIRVVSRHTATKERLQLYRDYITRRHRAEHGSSMTGDEFEFRSFLVASPLPGPRCVEFRLGRRLLAVGVFDETPNSYNAVYCYYDCDHLRRSLGTFNVLWLIEHARTNGKKYVYLGYCIDACPTMSYKAKFLPHERWHPEGRWERVDRNTKRNVDPQDG